jgi:hypothetical protein
MPCGKTVEGQSRLVTTFGSGGPFIKESGSCAPAAVVGLRRLSMQFAPHRTASGPHQPQNRRRQRRAPSKAHLRQSALATKLS